MMWNDQWRQRCPLICNMSIFFDSAFISSFVMWFLWLLFSIRLFFVACLMSHFVALIFDFRSTLRIPTIYRICVRWFFRRIRVFTLISFTIYWCKCVSPVLPKFPAILSWTWSKALNLRTDMKPIFKIDLYFVRVDFRMFSFNFLNHKTHDICFGKVSWNRISSNSSDEQVPKIFT